MTRTAPGSGHRCGDGRASGTPYPRPGLRGFSLLEVLVALLVLAIGLLGLAALQTRGVKFNHYAYARSQATYLAYEIMDLMRANRARAPQYVDQEPDPKVCACNPGVSTDVANDMCCWTKALDAALPSGNADLTQPNGKGTPHDYNDDRFEVTIRWQDRGSKDPLEKQQTWTFDQVWRP